MEATKKLNEINGWKNGGMNEWINKRINQSLKQWMDKWMYQKWAHSEFKNINEDIKV